MEAVTEPPVLRLLMVRLNPAAAPLNMSPFDGLLTAGAAAVSLGCCATDAPVMSYGATEASPMLGNPA